MQEQEETDKKSDINISEQDFEKIREKLKTGLDKSIETIIELDNKRMEAAIRSHFAIIHLLLFSATIASPILLIWITASLAAKIIATVLLFGLSQFIAQFILVKSLTRKQ